MSTSIRFENIFFKKKQTVTSNHTELYNMQPNSKCNLQVILYHQLQCGQDLCVFNNEAGILYHIYIARCKTITKRLFHSSDYTCAESLIHTR